MRKGLKNVAMAGENCNLDASVLVQCELIVLITTGLLLHESVLHH